MGDSELRTIVSALAHRCRLLCAGACALVLAGCAAVPQDELPGDPKYAPLAAPSATPEFRTQGAVQYARFGSSLFSDRRAMQVGDILTVRLIERTAASKDADTQITKESDINLDPGVILGSTPNIGNNSMGTNITQTRDFQGQAESTQSNSLNGNVAVTVTDVLPNGLMRVRGEKWLRLNRGDEYIRLTGVLRPEDVAPDNSIASTKLADARISYSGTGEFASSNRMGWLGKFFNSSWWPL
jgi:flagellar L-ring protein FlgH